MITEDYVSFETAKLLRKKGFTDLCVAYYDCFTTDNFHCGYEPTDFNSIDTKYRDIVAAPTLQMAMKWLREVHNLCIEPYRTACGYLSTISKIPTGSTLYSQEYEGDDEDSGQFTSYEKSCEAAIEYCLKKLI